MNPTKPDENEIAQRAYKLWEAEGRPEGRDVAHWHQAEQDVSEPVTQPVEEVAPDVEETPVAAEPAVEAAAVEPISAADAVGEVVKPKRARKPKAVADETVPAEPKAKAPRRRKAAAPEA